MKKEIQTRYTLLSNIEREVLKLLAEGVKIEDIGQRLCLPADVVVVHKAALMKKLGISESNAPTRGLGTRKLS